MRKLALKLTYDGGDFAGWQRQQNAPSVQQTLEDAWQQLFSEVIKTTGASRTDAGVHARGQIVMFTTQQQIPEQNVLLALNSRLPAGVAVLAAKDVPEAFHARYGARGKHYTYQLETGRIRPVLERHVVAYKPTELDLKAMQAALCLLQGERDFTAFMDQGSPTKRAVRHLIEAKVEADGSRFIFHFRGDGFLYHMVRILVGTALMVGTHKLSQSDMMALVERKQRVGLGQTMPPEGLCLERVYYEDVLFGADDRRALHAYVK